jgi:hypothetical protein
MKRRFTGRGGVDDGQGGAADDAAGGVALRHRTRNMLKIGLLNEAKTFVEHGEWLPWLQRHTALPARTAQRYMAAAAWVDAKNATVAYLDLDYLSPGAIYALASGKFSAEIVEQVLTAAATRQRHIGEADVREIAKEGAKGAILKGIEADQKAEAEAEAARLLSLAKAKGFASFATWEALCEAWEAAQQAEEAEAKQKQAEVETILDRGPDPDLPPPSEPITIREGRANVFVVYTARSKMRLSASLDIAAVVDEWVQKNVK